MRIRQLGSSIGDAESRQHLTTFLINETVAIDAGCLGLVGPVTAQQRIKHVLISHSHIDHIASLPLFLDNIFEPNDDCPTIYGSDDVWYALTNDVMNDRLWPDLSRIAGDDFRFYNRAPLLSEVPVVVDGLTITPVEIDHIVPTVGFMIEDDHSSAIIVTDTGPTDRIWELASKEGFRRKLKAVFLECSFPNSYEWLAVKSKHLCPRSFSEQHAKVASGPPFLTIAVHLKASMFEQTAEELNELKLGNFTIGGQDQSWDFC